MNLTQYGWNSFFEEAFEELNTSGWRPGRIAAEFTHQYRVYTEVGEVTAEVSGKLRFEATSQADFPAVGDWVALSIRESEGKATIHSVLPRKSKFSRKMAGLKIDEQIVAANVDTVFIVVSLNNDFNLRRLERALILAWESGSNPAIVLSKADLCLDVAQKVAQVQGIAVGVPVHVISSLNQEGLAALEPYLQHGHTVALLGSSGVGKSTLVNALCGVEVQRVNDIREDDHRGRHTTTHRELIVLPSGALIMDTPGMRELQLWSSDEGFSQTFADIETLAQGCQFNDCTHDREPGCAVQEAISTGELALDRFRSYKKTLKELAFIDRKTAESERRMAKSNGRTNSSKRVKQVRW